MYCNEVVLAACRVLFVSAASQAPDGACLDLRAAVYQDTVVNRLPLVIRVTLGNTCQSPVPAWYYGQTTDLMEHWAVLVATNDAGQVFHLNYVGGPRSRGNLPLPMPLANGQPVTRDFVRSLIFREKPAPRWAGSAQDLLRFLPPGVYSAHIELLHLDKQKITSNEFEFAVVEPQGADEPGADKIALRHVDFLEGRNRPMDESWYDGRSEYKKVDVSHFGELQQILEEHPKSTYSEWIRFWKLYHHGPLDEAVEWARSHRDFPLTDNLMLRMADRLFHQAGKYERAKFNRVRELVAELLRDFPEADTREQTLELQDKLKQKP